MLSLDKAVIGVIGLGYVGLPLAVEFGKRYPTVGFDIDPVRIRALREGVDKTREVDREELAAAQRLGFTRDADELRACNVFIVTVPTPIDVFKTPDFTPVIGASETIGSVLKPADVVIYESTVYPGATEEVCVPILERVSGLRFNVDFFAGYSPERINPGDRQHRVASIRKVTSGSTPEAAAFVDALYASIIPAGTHRASSIKVAEAAKVIENTQRDVNIALINELAMIFERIGIDTAEVLEAAATKWNFLPFRPGLVGGHCIGVDPYYLTHKAQAVGHHAEMILAGRRINDGMGAYVARRVMKLICRRERESQPRVLVLGLAFKENCPDLRNTKVVDIVRELRHFSVAVDVHDPWVDAAEAMREYALELVAEPASGRYDAVILAVAHERFRERGAAWMCGLLAEGGALFDVKSVLPASAVDGRL